MQNGGGRRFYLKLFYKKSSVRHITTKLVALVVEKSDIGVATFKKGL